MHYDTLCCIISIYTVNISKRGEENIRILDYLYPSRCPVCGDIISPRQHIVCPGCVNTFQVIKEPKCLKCGKPLEQEEQEYCFDCTKINYHYNRGYALWVYDKNVRKSIANFKFHNRREYSKYYIQEILHYYKKEIITISPEVLIPVPLHKSKLKERGFNQADLLARGIGESVGIPVVEDYLMRCNKTKAQKRLNDRERAKNLYGAFEVNPSYSTAPFAKVMLVDDIYTTGSTIDACAEVLLRTGVKEIYFISLSIGKGY
ncbi:double zinc ribbon domain-containing protein [Anaerosporobacter sp.]